MNMTKKTTQNQQSIFLIIGACTLAAILISVAVYLYFSREQTSAGQKALDGYKVSATQLAEDLKDNPDDITLNTEYAYALYVTQDPEAITAHTKLVELNSSDDRAYNQLGNLYRKEKEYTKALDAYTQAVTINPENVNAYINKAHTYLQDLDDSENGIQVLTEAIEKNKSEANLYILLAKKQQQLGNSTQAIEVLQQLLEVDPEHETAKKLLSELSGESNQQE